MAEKRFEHEPKQHVVVPFPGRVVAESCARTRVDSYRWFRFRLKNSFTGAVPLSERDVGRIWRLIQDPATFHPFAVFDSPTRHIGLNLHYVTCTQFDGHLGTGLLADALPDTRTVDIVFSDSKEPVHIEVEPDELVLWDGDHEQKHKVVEDDAAAALVQVAILFSYCESMHLGSDYVERLQDVSSSSIWIRLNEIALVSAPIGHIKAK